MKKGLGTVLGIIAIAAGLVAIFRIVVDTEIAVGFVTISFGVLAIIWTSMAATSLSKGSSLYLKFIINLISKKVIIKITVIMIDKNINTIDFLMLFLLKNYYKINLYR